MAYKYSDLIARARHWAEQAQQNGWINSQQFQSLTTVDAGTPDTLFADRQSRPLMIAFLGGTGVGKSSLINRLAGREVARTGVERPTSREVTLYHHQSVVLDCLPQSMPIDKIKLAAHDDERRRHLIWIDMPDMDSTEQKNKQLVLQWLPHIDILVYVVSPERYRDNKAWRLLLAEGAKHAWVFVMNQWDRAQSAQYDDFILQLEKAGFTDPIVKRTVSDPKLLDQQQDEFGQLEAVIQQLAEQNTIHQLELRGLEARKNELRQRLLGCLQQLGEETAYVALFEQWEQHWQLTEQMLIQGFDWPLQRLAVAYVQSAAHLLTKDSQAQTGKDKSILWDDWAQNRLEDVLDEVVLSADQHQLPVAPIRNSLSPLKQKAKQIILTQTELAARQALANPGNALQRFLLKFSGICATVLPLAAMGWVGYQVFEGYYDSSHTTEAYLGVNFAIHSVLLILIAWLLPFFLQKKLKPSMEKVALKGLRKGLQVGLATIDTDVRRSITENKQQRAQCIQELQEIIDRCQAQPEELGTVTNQDLARMLIG